MSTRGVIGIELDNGKVVYTWVGHDAGSVGATLTQVVKEYQKRVDLIRGDEICSLYGDGEVDYYDDSRDDWLQCLNSIDQLKQETENDIFTEYLYIIDHNNLLGCCHKSNGHWKLF